MYKLVTSKFLGNKEISTVEESNDEKYLENQCFSQFFDGLIESAYILKDTKVFEVLDNEEFRVPTKDEEFCFTDVFNNDTVFISNDREVYITKYINEDDNEGTNTFFTINKDCNVKDLKNRIKELYQVVLKNISMNVENNKIIRDLEQTEGSFYDKNYCYDIMF